MNTNITDEIFKLKKERNAVILAHYYQTLDVQLIADFVGDSLDLSKKAKSAQENLIVFCGVRFMAESAKLLSPEKTVLLPNKNAGCPMADMVTPEIVKNMRAEHPSAAVVCYVNSSAATKAECDICCTSSNAVRVVRSLPQTEIIFVPDKNLGAYVAAFVPEKIFHFMQGYCPIHRFITAEETKKSLAKNPLYKFAAHPECESDVLELADFIGSTSQILEYCEKSIHNSFLIGTEYGVVERLRHFHPEKTFDILTPSLVCPNMKKTTLTNIYDVLLNGSNEIFMDEELIVKANIPLELMLNVT